MYFLLKCDINKKVSALVGAFLFNNSSLALYFYEVTLIV